jgi:hypothetical protein
LIDENTARSKSKKSKRRRKIRDEVCYLPTGRDESQEDNLKTEACELPEISKKQPKSYKIKGRFNKLVDEAQDLVQTLSKGG